MARKSLQEISVKERLLMGRLTFGATFVALAAGASFHLVARVRDASLVEGVRSQQVNLEAAEGEALNAANEVVRGDLIVLR